MNTIKINITMSVFLLCAILSSCKYDNAEDLKYPNWTYLNTQNSKLPSDHIYCLRLDSKGNVWALCGKNYVARIDRFLNISVFEIPFSDSIEVNLRVALELNIDKLDRVYIGARTNPLYRLSNYKWEKIYCNEKFYSARTIGFDENNNLWFGTAPQGIFKQNGDTFINYNFFNSNLASGEITNILVNSSRNVFILTEFSPPVNGKSSVSFFDGSTFKVLVSQNDTTGIHGSNEFIMKDENTMAICGKNKINEFANGQFKQFGHDSLYANKYCCASDFIYDNKSGYWITSILGLTNIQQSKSKLYNRMNSGLPDDNLNALVLDKNRNLFISVFGKGLAIYHLMN